MVMASTGVLVLMAKLGYVLTRSFQTPVMRRNGQRAPAL